MTRWRPALAALAASAAALTPAAGAQSLGAIRGIVRDSLASAPLAGAAVQLALEADLGSVRTAISDSLGRFAFDSLAAGRYVMGFVHPEVVALGIDMPMRAVDVAPAGVTPADIALPGARTLRRALCSGADGPDSTGAISGVVRDAVSGSPLDATVVTASWRELRFTRGRIAMSVERVTARTEVGGVFLLCGAPSGVELALRAGRATGQAGEARANGEVTVLVPPRGLVRQDVLLGDPASADARLAGSVRDARGRPVGGATVTVLGGGVTTTTASGGAFRLDGLPRGSRTLEVRAVGYTPVRVAVALTRDTAATAHVVLQQYVPALDRIVVMGKAPRQWADIEGFLARRRRHIGGAFLTLADLERRGGHLATDALHGVRGLNVHPAGDGFTRVVRGRGGCRPDVFLNGTHVSGGSEEIDQLVGPNDLMAVEVYGGPGDTPAEFTPPFGGGCGAVVLWTKR